MRFKKLTSAIMAAVVAATCITTSQVVFADATFASASDFITDVVNTALAEVTSATKDDAIATMQSKLTTSGDAVLYDGNTIGYWYSDASTTLYADNTKTDTLFKKTASGYDVDPTLIETLLSDINNDLVDTYIPTTTDWSKIVGKYDITLGDITIPANQWLSLDVIADAEPISSNDVTNVSALTGINATTLVKGSSEPNSLCFVAYAIDKNGKLYLGNSIKHIWLASNGWAIDQFGFNHANSGVWFDESDSQYDATFPDTIPLLKVGMKRDGSDLVPRVYVASYTNDKYRYVNGNTAETRADMNKFYLIEDSGETYTYAESTLKSCGIFYFTLAQSPTIVSAYQSKFIEMFTSNSASRQVTGNTTLAKRLVKLTALDAADTLTVTPTAWLVNGTGNIDTYMSTQNMLSAGDTADINAVAEIEPLSFNVVVPTTLPIYVATDGTVSTATNATVKNKSNAAVRITAIDIREKAESGWTLVDDNPSDVRDAKEFTFETSLAVNQVLQRDEILPFSYQAELSPMTNGEDSLDLATVSVTVDWAD